MKKFSLFSFLLLVFGVMPLFSQDLPRFRGWLDEEHFLLLEDRELFKVNAADGEKEKYEEEEQASPTEYLPEGISISWYNTTYSKSEDKLVVTHENDIWFASAEDKNSSQLTANPEEEKNPTFSPNEKMIAFTRDNDLYVLDTESGLERRLTNDASQTISNGYASWVYYEEILGRSTRYKAFYWSPNSDRIAFLRFDNEKVPTFSIFHDVADDMTHGYLEETQYPKAGDPLPEVTLGVADVKTGEITWMEKVEDMDYLAWVEWTPGGDKLLFQQMNRDQNMIEIYLANPATGKIKRVYDESQTTWVEFFEDLYFLPDDKGFIVRSNQDGWFNLYHYNFDGKLVNKMTDVDWRVKEILEVDEENGKIYFEGTGEVNTDQHIFVVDMDGKNLRQLTEGAGYHVANFSPSGKYFFEYYNNVQFPGEMVIRNSKGKKLHTIARSENDKNVESGRKVELFTIPSTEGFNLPVHWVLPPDFDENKKYPVIFSIYGGPNSEGVHNRYRNYTRPNEEVIFISVDHRGSGKFGKKGLDYLHRSLGKWEIHDYIEAVKWLRKKPFVDATKIAIRGGSYGGYMAAMALTLGADYFTHGVSRSPVTDWRLYDNIYTERYMDTPQDNPEGYEFGSVMTHADSLKGELLIIHGTIDDNVHMQNTMQLISKLQDLGKDFEMMVYPGGRHGWGGPKRDHSLELQRKFWTENGFYKKVKP